uniref:Bone morphogenetic protein 15 n=1 Tax=Neogobius melanostomus TaxID=47308 RepID=A0A8C6TQG4_9GOBI
ELASARGLTPNMRLFSCVLLFLLTCTVSTRETRPSTRPRTRRSQQHVHGSRHKGADQNLQFMLSLYRSAAGPDGRPKRHRKFGSNTVRLLRPTASSVQYLPATRDHHFSFTVQYNLDTLPSEQLLKASFVHLRSPPPPLPWTPAGSLVTLEPHQRWTETDITDHVLRGGTTGHLNVTAHYWCADPWHEGAARPWWSRWLPFSKRRNEKLQELHLEVPSLLLYLEEEEGSTTSSFRTSASSPIISDLPGYKRKTGTPKNRCKLHSFRLSFDKLGWGHYFIAPPVYNPRFCRGDCPRVLHDGFNSPNHAIIQNAIHELGLGEVPPPSCVPYKYLPLSVLVVHKKKVEYKELEDMVADSCTCR